MPFNVSEEHSLLTSMISDRDAQISSLMHQLHSASELLHHTQREHQTQSASRKSQRSDHTSTIQRLKEEHTEQRRILSKFEQSIKNGGGLRVHEYASLMRSANSSDVESSYVLRLQAQLCRAMHSLGVMESQLALVKDIFSGLIKFMKEDLSQMADDRTRREIELMNVLAKVDDEKRVMGIQMEKKIQEKEELLDQVREEYEELGLEYDENEVKRALEVRYLLEQMEKVKEDKVRLEKELFAALLEREEQINRLKLENVSLEKKLDGLKREEEVDNVDSNEGQVGEQGGIASSADHCDDDQNILKETYDVHVDNEPGETSQTGGRDDDEATPLDDDAQFSSSNVTNQLKNADILDDELLQIAEESEHDEEGRYNTSSKNTNDANKVECQGEKIARALSKEGATAIAGADAADDHEIDDKRI